MQISAVPDNDADPFLWLEEYAGERAIAWAHAESERTLSVFEQDPRFAGFVDQATRIAEAEERIPDPSFRGGLIYNFWQDPQHIRGLWRRASYADYLSAHPTWHPVLDLDALSVAERANWVWHGAVTEPFHEQRCLVSLSDGGEDAITIREFDLVTGAFVQGGFHLPCSKQVVAWWSPDEILVASDWGPGTLTASGYPYIVKRLKRGQDLHEAQEIYRARPQDMEAGVETLVDGDGNQLTLIFRRLGFFEVEYFLVGLDDLVRIALPLKQDILALVGGQIIIKLRQDWITDGTRCPSGSLIAIALSNLRESPGQLNPVIVLAPGPRESIEQVAGTNSALLVTLYDNVRGRACRLRRAADGQWQREHIALPDHSSIEIAAADRHGERAFYSVCSFLNPSSLWVLDGQSREAREIKTLPAQFDASDLMVQQFTATSKDGTRVPYFIVHRNNLLHDGSNATILNAYGGFEISKTPVYLAQVGKLWLEHGGVFVLANIRGGGEFGPAWHEAGLKTQRQRIYDDFYSVAEDLIARRVTSPRRLGIEGGSNGGLLMGVAMTQRPELWAAIDIRVPLLDMLRYEFIAAGASWVAEYGSVSIPEERRFLASISPYHQLRAGIRYPHALIWTTSKDDRVGPQHARKFAAKLKSLGVPYYYYEPSQGGHGSGANLKESAHVAALELIYFTRQLMDHREPRSAT
ncbi:MAG: prolyl oligopeptidase family serine peptidase [Steroidobacteraceae bacterium]|jgi:prolyl oligopeptidase